ncbi:MAG: hypothetical protein HY752_02600 [Nitrospirae bacterium]|nr:hypothetical protein [Nitrospirota bacterium]
MNKLQKETLGKFFVDVSKAIVLGYGISFFFGKTFASDALMALGLAGIMLSIGIYVMGGENK